MDKFFARATAAVLLALLAASANSQVSDRADGMRFIPDVVGQFSALTDRPEAMGFHIEGTVDPSFCKHYQGIVRVDSANGTPYFLLTRSGNDPEKYGLDLGIVCDDSDGERGMGNLVVVKMDSRTHSGERLRSNRLRKGEHVDLTPPPTTDRAVKFFSTTEDGLVEGYGDWPPGPDRVFQHPGGMQVVGHALALAMDTPAPQQVASDKPSAVLFFDISNPESPQLKSKFFPWNAEGPLRNADAMAVTAMPDGHYLLVVTGGFGGPFFFYRSSIANATDDDNVLLSPHLGWTFVGYAAAPDTEDAHQSIHLIREGSMNGTLYLAGARGHPVFSDHDRIDLYRVHCDVPNCARDGQIHLDPEATDQHITPLPNTGGRPTADLAAATGFYESPTGELIFYATQHENVGPDSTVNMGEWRHIGVVRPGSPTLKPTVDVGGPYVVDEGGRVALEGGARSPITRAWIQLFTGPDYQGWSPIVDYGDRDKDDYDDFGILEQQALNSFTLSDQASSWIWYAPAGCSIQVLDHKGATLDETKTLAGDGFTHADPDLAFVTNDAGDLDLHNEIDAVAYLPSCFDYYGSPFDLKWDLDVNGTYETLGSPVVFSAAAFDGPSQVSVPAIAVSRVGGDQGQRFARVTVRNVAPRVAPLVITDSSGRRTDQVPFVLVDTPLMFSTTFTDPGLLDHQTARMEWGDTTVDIDRLFEHWDDAFGDGTGSASSGYRYTYAGDFEAVLTVKDDDGGIGTASETIHVVTPETAVGELLSTLDSVISGTTGKLRSDLEKARKALVGSNGSNDGALAKIRQGNISAAIAFLRQAIDALKAAQAGGADVALLIAMLEQVIAALQA